MTDTWPQREAACAVGARPASWAQGARTQLGFPPACRRLRKSPCSWKHAGFLFCGVRLLVFVVYMRIKIIIFRTLTPCPPEPV